MRKEPGQYLTAVFELSPSRRKAAVMSRVLHAADDVFWRVIETEGLRERAGAAAAGNHDDRVLFTKYVEREARAVSVQAGLCEPVEHGLTRDLVASVKSFVRLRARALRRAETAEGETIDRAEWPARPVFVATAHDDALDALATAVSLADEAAARDALALAACTPGPRPLIIARSRDARLLRETAGGPIMLALNVLRGSETTRAATIRPGFDAVTGEILKGGMTRTRLLVPVSLGQWHQNKFLNGRAVLRSSLIFSRGDRWFLAAQFEFPHRQQRQTGARLGIDRGIVNPAAIAVVNGEGALLAIRDPAGAEIGLMIRAAERKRATEQKRRGATSHRHGSLIDGLLHRLANGVVAEAKQFGAGAVIEKLDGLKNAMRAKRRKGAPKGGWRQSLRKAQLGKLETILNYKLALAGLSPVSEVLAGGTSITCPRCATRDKANRPDQAVFQCVACGLSAHADTIGAINIARRGIVLTNIAKGAKLAPLERDMAKRLRSLGDGGLGPLAASTVAASGFVAARASAVPAYDPSGLTGSGRGEKSNSCAKKRPGGRIPRGSAREFAELFDEKSPLSELVAKDWLQSRAN
jgi:IS605 OrfB family transposase